MFSSVWKGLRSTESKNDTKSISTGQNKSRKREIVLEDQATDVLQTPPNKRAKNTGGPGTVGFFGGLFTSAMNFKDKYKLWDYVVGGRKQKQPKPIPTIDLDAEDNGNKEVKSSTMEGDDVVYIGTKSRDVIICEDKQRFRYTAPTRQNMGEKKPERLKPTSLSDSITARKPLPVNRIKNSSSHSYIQSFTPLRQPDDHARDHIPVYIIPDVPSLPQDDWKNKSYNARNYEEVKEKRTSVPVYRRASEAPKSLTFQQKVALVTENKAFKSNLNLSQKPDASKLQGKIRVRHSKESPRRSAISHRPSSRSTAHDVIRLAEKQRYVQLLSQFTSFPLATMTDKESISNKENSVISISSHSPKSDTSIFAVHTPELHKRSHRSVEGSILSPRSCLLPSNQSFHHSTPLSPVQSHPAVLKVMPSTTKFHSRSEHVEDLPLFSKQESFGLMNQSTISTRTPQPVAEENDPLSGLWTKKWKNILSPDNLQKERERSRIEREEEKLEALRAKRREKQESAIEEVKERIRIEEESEEEEEEEAFIPLTEEIEREVDNALGPGKPSETLAEGFKISISRGDMATLSNLNWLNDEIINIYFSLIAERSKSEGFPKVHTFNSFFYPKLIKSGYDSLKRWTRRVDIFAMDMILVPIHLGMHWCLAVIDFRSKTIKYFDSLKGSNNQCIDALQKYLLQESLDKKKVPYDTTSWTLSCPKDIPEQLNGCDCGVFACKYAEFITRDAKFTFNQQDMPYFRRRMVYEILKMKLL